MPAVWVHGEQYAPGILPDVALVEVCPLWHPPAHEVSSAQPRKCSISRGFFHKVAPDLHPDLSVWREILIVIIRAGGPLRVAFEELPLCGALGTNRLEQALGRRQIVVPRSPVRVG